ncbi:Taicatoxin, serine protease inhibitor component [Gryllus bimaculatus]|nr:Taicatoxin, serine protease inhibitor component [Gryllus bimaculatus]
MNCHVSVALAIVLLCAAGASEAQENLCRLPSDSGSCFAYIPSYFFNSATGSCEKYIYGGCEGNAKRFSTVSDCENRCLPS